MRRLLGDEFGKHSQNSEPEVVVELHDLADDIDMELSADGGTSDATYTDEWALRIELAELRAELEAARRENESLLVEKDTAGELVLNLRKQVQDLENESGGPDQRARRAPTQPDANEPVFRTLGAWVERWLLPLYRRELDNRSTTFCVQWWRHPEAYYRLDALWKSWEFMRLKPGTGTAVWMKDYCDPHIAVLMSSNGPMSGCTLKRHSDHATEPWPLEPIPSIRQLVRLYDIAGLQYTDPKPAFEGRRALGAVEAAPWDGKDQR